MDYSLLDGGRGVYHPRSGGSCISWDFYRGLLDNIHFLDDALLDGGPFHVLRIGVDIFHVLLAGGVVNRLLSIIEFLIFIQKAVILGVIFFLMMRG